MKQYDVLVIGSGCGMSIVDEARRRRRKVALVDKGPLGGTCMNLGCIPSKMLVYPADVVADIQEAGKLGVDAAVRGVDFGAIMDRMRRSRQESRDYVRGAVEKADDLDLYVGEGHFVADYTMEVNGQRIRGDKVFIASGSRPLIPPIKGLDGVDYLTNENVLELKKRPDSIVIIGGGYIALEYAHFFAGIGTGVTILEMLDRLAQSEEPEISALLETELSKRMTIHMNTQAEEVRKDSGEVTVAARDRVGGRRKEFAAAALMIAVGRRSNADLLKVEKTSVELDKRGYIAVDDYLETGRQNIFAVGDANGQQMFLHVANREAAVAWYNATHKKRVVMDYSAAPHALFTHPQVASVGLTEEAAAKDYHVMVGRAKYFDTAKGEAMMEESGFAKAIVDAHSGRILGFHIVGPHAPILIQEVVNAMAAGGKISSITRAMHIHPALPEVIERTFENLEDAEPHSH